MAFELLTSGKPVDVIFVFFQKLLFLSYQYADSDCHWLTVLFLNKMLQPCQFHRRANPGYLLEIPDARIFASSDVKIIRIF